MGTLQSVVLVTVAHLQTLRLSFGGSNAGNTGLQPAAFIFHHGGCDVALHRTDENWNIRTDPGTASKHWAAELSNCQPGTEVEVRVDSAERCSSSCSHSEDLKEAGTRTFQLAASGGSADDPHFLGFLGQRFDFTGIPGKAFAWYSDVDIQVNGLLTQNPDDNKVYMTKLGVRFGPDHKVLLSVEPNYKLAVAPFDEAGQTLGDCGRWWWTEDSSRLVLQYHGYTLVAERRKPADSEIQHINLAMSPYVRTSSGFVHGLLGQTHRPSTPVPGGLQGEGVLEGAIEDYLVRDGVIGTKWAFNRYNGTRGAYTRAECAALLKSPRVVPQELALSGITGGTFLP